jgi:RNA polymerase sigma-70 factor (ECF subfamily)
MCVIPDERRPLGPGKARAEAAEAGGVGAFDRLIETRTPRLYRIVRRFASDDGEAEALVQETWLRAWKAFPKVDQARPLLPWLATIAIRAARDAWRRRDPLDFADLGGEADEVEDEIGGPEPALERVELIRRLVAGVATLRPEYRMVIALRYDAGLGYEETARALGIPVNTVRTHLRRARAELRAWLEAG